MNKYINRYILWWQAYHHGWSSPTGMQELAVHICEQIIFHQISYKKFDEILTFLEDEQKELPHNFSIVAYCLDFIASEKEEVMMSQAVEDSRPIILPKEGKPIRLIENPNIKNALEKIKKNNPELLKILERINLHRVKTAYHVCAACKNTGFITIGVLNGIEEIFDHQKDYDLTKVRRCKCSVGENLTKKCRQASEM